MTLIISPKTTRRVIRAFRDVFDLRKVPKEKTRFWHGNFRDAFYENPDGSVRVLFAGYSGAVVGQAILEYAERYLPMDEVPRIYFVGSVFAFRDSRLELGDVAYAVDTFSPDSFEQAIYQHATAREISNIQKPDFRLLNRVLAAARKAGVPVKPTRIYCKISPGYMPDFVFARQLMGEAMWWKFALGKIRYKDFDSGEYESAAALATSRLLGIPAAALLDVKDKRMALNDYRIASAEQKEKALYAILGIIKESLCASVPQKSTR